VARGPVPGEIERAPPPYFVAPNVVNPVVATAAEEEEEEEEDELEEPRQPNPGSPVPSIASEASMLSEAGVEPVSPRAVELGEMFAKMALEKGFTPKTNKAAIKHAYNLLVPKECACGTKLKGKYADIGVCAVCSSAAKKHQYCRLCETGLRGKYVEGGICSGCTKLQERKEHNAAKKK
jgi:hypothetical protein